MIQQKNKSKQSIFYTTILFILLTLPALAQYNIEITDNAYTPADLTITIGQRITWTNKGTAPHTVTGTGISSGNLNTGDTFTKIFDTPGTHTYGCDYHPSMKGTITVLAQQAQQQTEPPAGALVVVIRDNFFEPADLTIQEGETVLWQNEGTRKHTVSATSPTGTFESGELNPGQRYFKTFTTPGTHRYQCSIHPAMQGSITVKPKQQTQTTPQPSQSLTTPPSSTYLQPTAPLDIQRLEEIERGLTLLQEQQRQQQQEQQNLKIQVNNAQEQTQDITAQIEQLSIKPSKIPTILLILLNIILIGIVATPHVIPYLTKHTTQENQLTTYITQAQQTGKTKEQIKNELLLAGWNEEEIEKALGKS